MYANLEKQTLHGYDGRYIGRFRIDNACHVYLIDDDGRGNDFVIKDWEATSDQYLIASRIRYNADMRLIHWRSYSDIEREYDYC